MFIMICPSIESDEDNSDDEEDDDDDDDEGLDDDPTIEHINVNHMGGVNRIRSMPQSPGIIATMSDVGKSYIYDLSTTVNSLMSKGPRITPSMKPTFTYTGHEEEGYALDWNPIIPGRLATGDCTGVIRLWNPSQSVSVITSNNVSSLSWQVDSMPFTSHKGSVEDIQWSPTEATVFSSCSSDKTVRIWDIRDKSKSQITIDAHLEDVNVISWNKSVSYLLASGCDDGSFKVYY